MAEAGQMIERRLLFAVVTAIGASSLAHGTQGGSYRIDPARSRATIHVGKAGAFSFIAGHTHEVSGAIESGAVLVDLDVPSRSRIELAIAAADLKVSAAGEPEGDAPKVQEAMDSDKVLDVGRYPRITYESTRIAVKDRRGNVLELNVAGNLTIRSVTQPVTAPVRVELAEAGLSAAGRFDIKQTSFGIKPVSVGGVVAVKDTLAIEFSIVAAKAP
jgi:polyisoprenoid-binding protein YceI